MRILADTHTLIWAANNTLAKEAQDVLIDNVGELYFSTVSLIEIALKQHILGIDIIEFHNRLLEHGYEELTLTARQIAVLSTLPNIHKDPFDRLLIAQAKRDNLFLLTADKQIMKYLDFHKQILIFQP
jgi:PIN domain nuclease of toxin-antitoxin system